MSALEKFGILVILVLVVIIGVVAVWGVGGAETDGDLLAGAPADGYSAIPEPGGDRLPPWPGAGAGGGVAPVDPSLNGGTASVPPPSLGSAPTPPVPGPSVDVRSTPAPIPPAPEPATARTYTVRSGDTLSKIAREQLGDANRWTAIRDANAGVDPNRLRPGQTLRLPGGDAMTAVRPAPQPRVESVVPAPAVKGFQVNPDDGPTLGSTPAPARDAAAAGVEYEVRKGETLSSIARDRLGKSSDWYRILELNPGLDPRRLREGQRIRIPSAQ